MELLLRLEKKAWKKEGWAHSLGEHQCAGVEEMWKVLGFPISPLGMMVLNAKLGAGCECSWGQQQPGWISAEARTQKSEAFQKCVSSCPEQINQAASWFQKKLKQPCQTFNRDRKGDWKLFLLRYSAQRGTKIKGKKEIETSQQHL